MNDTIKNRLCFLILMVCVYLLYFTDYGFEQDNSKHKLYEKDKPYETINSDRISIYTMHDLAIHELSDGDHFPTMKPQSVSKLQHSRRRPGARVRESLNVFNPAEQGFGYKKDSHKSSSIISKESRFSTSDALDLDTEQIRNQAIQLLADEISKLRAKLGSVDGPFSDDLEESSTIHNTSAEVGDILAPLQLSVLGLNQNEISKSSETYKKQVRSIPKPYFRKEFNNPCFIEEVTDETQRMYPIRRVLRSCDRARNFYSINKLFKILDGMPIELTDVKGKVAGKYRLRCLPYFYLLGFPKCGTTDIRSRLVLHSFIRDAVCKEPQYWDRRRFQRDVDFADYLDLFNLGAQKIVEQGASLNGKYPMILGDFSTRTIGNDYYWEKYEGNAGMTEPSYLLANEIYHLNPKTKFLIAMRNPTKRLFSDYMHFSHISVEDFHKQVVASIDWWNRCVRTHSLRRCLYGQPHDMPLIEQPGKYWNLKVSSQIRTGMYVHFIKDWLQVFPREQFLFIEFGEYVSDEVEYITEVILPFLNLGPLSDRKERRAARQQKANARSMHSSKAGLTMLPETSQILQKFYEPFNQQLAELLQDDVYLWNET